MTRRASRIGFFTCFTPATAPAIIVRPSMIDASSSFVPSCVKTAPLPALNCGESSRMTTAACTASRLEPPAASTLWPAVSASVMADRISAWRSPRLSSVKFPAPV